MPAEHVVHGRILSSSGGTRKSACEFFVPDVRRPAKSLPVLLVEMQMNLLMRIGHHDPFCPEALNGSSP